MNGRELRVGTLRADAGRKISGVYLVENTTHRMPVTLINGERPGKTVLVTAGIHGCEYVGIQAAMELARELEPHELAGKAILVHPVNTSGFEALAPAVIPESGENLNRLFPGNPDGSYGERIAHALTVDFQDQADFYLDLHGGDMSEAMTPFVFYPGEAEEAVVEESRRVARGLAVRYMLKSKAVTGAYNSAAKRGTPSVLIERGGNGVWSRSEVDAYKADVRRALALLGLLAASEAKDSVSQPPKEVINPVYLAAEANGCWHPAIAPGDAIGAGQKIGVLKDWFGNTVSEYHSESDAVVLYVASSLAVKKGCELVAYATAAE